MQTYKPYVKVITFSGSAQRLIDLTETDVNKKYATWASVEALDGNANRCYIGDSSVSSTQYSTSLAANEAAQIGGPDYAALGGSLRGRVDLSQVYIIGTSTQKAMVTVFIPDSVS